MQDEAQFCSPPARGAGGSEILGAMSMPPQPAAMPQPEFAAAAPFGGHEKRERDRRSCKPHGQSIAEFAAQLEGHHTAPRSEVRSEVSSLAGRPAPKKSRAELLATDSQDALFM